MFAQGEIYCAPGEDYEQENHLHVPICIDAGNDPFVVQATSQRTPCSDYAATHCANFDPRGACGANKHILATHADCGDINFRPTYACPTHSNANGYGFPNFCISDIDTFTRSKSYSIRAGWHRDCV